MIAYAGGLALVAIVGMHVSDHWPVSAPLEPAAKADWGRAERSYPSFAVSPLDLAEKTETYEILRHPEGGRKDIIRWWVQGEKPVAELEIYRLGGEAGESGALVSESTAEIGTTRASGEETAGVINSKFGIVSLLRLTDTHSCLGFVKRFDQANLRISGWSCQGGTLSARRAAIRCTLDHSDPASGRERPQARRTVRPRWSSSAAVARPPTPLRSRRDWVTGTEDPLLRGSL